MSVLNYEDVQHIESPEGQGLQKALNDYQIPIALTALGALFLLS